jgi:hypothetical protein
METDYPSTLSIKNKQTTNVHHQSIDTDHLVPHDDLLNTIISPDNSCYYDALASPVQSNIFPDNFFEQIETFNNTNNKEKLSSIHIDHLITKNDDVYSNSSVNNIVQDINKQQSCINHLLFVYDDTVMRIDEQSKINKTKNVECSTDNQNEMVTDNNLNPTESSIEQFIEPKQNFNELKSDFLLSEVHLTSSNDYHQSSFNSENNLRQTTNDIDDDFEELYQRYLTNFDQYQTMMDGFEQNQYPLTPIHEESTAFMEHVIKDKTIKTNDINQFCLNLSVKRQSNHIGHYGFEFQQTYEGEIKISSIIDSTYCPNLNVGDEIISINNNSTLTTLEQYYLLFHSLWHQQCEYVQLVVRKPINITIIPSKYRLNK